MGLAAAVLAVCMGGTSAAWQRIGGSTHEAGNLEVSVSSFFHELPVHGYCPLRVEIDNDTRRDVTLHFTTSSSGGGYRAVTNFDAAFTLTAETGKTARHEILAPMVLSAVLYGGYGDLRIDYSGTGVAGERLGLNSNSPSTVHHFGVSPVSSRLEWDEVLLQMLGGTSSGYSSDGTVLRFDLDDPPENWRAYSGLDAMVIQPQEWLSIPPAARAGILDWVRHGGRLVLWTTDGTMPTATDLGIDGIHRGCLGLGTIVMVEKAVPAGANPVSADDITGGHPAFAASILGDYSASRSSRQAWGVGKTLGERPFHSAWMVLLMIGFAIVIGPVNLFVFAKADRRHRLFLTTPLIAIGASVLIAAAILLQDGFGGRGARATVTFLDPTLRKAFITQEQIARTGVLVGRAFDTEEPALIAPITLRRTRWTFVDDFRSGPGSHCAYQLDGETFSGDWFRSRSEQAHFVRVVKPTRESVQILAGADSGDGRPTILSTLATPLEKLYYVDGDGAFWVGENIATGVKENLSASTQADFNAWWLDATDGLGGNLRARVRNAADATPGRFFAVAGDGKSAGFAIDTLDAIAWSERPALVFGITETIGSEVTATP